MSLSCGCGEWDGEGWFYYTPDDFTPLKTSRRKRCCSCKKLLSKESLVLRFERIRYPRIEIEKKIYSDDYEITIAPFYMCEECGDQYFNLSELGYCINIEDNMFDLLKEYQELSEEIKEVKRLADACAI